MVKKTIETFVDNRIDISTSGDIVNSDGSTMGQHDGVHEFTVGQRKGIPGGQGEPKYVTKIDVRNKKVFVGDKKDLLTSSFYLEDVSFVNGIENENLTIQTRYNSEDLPCEIKMITKNTLEVSLLEPTYGVAPGQFGVINDWNKTYWGSRSFRGP